MGKKSKQKRRRSIKTKNQRIRPDDYFQHGPFEMARFGRHTLMRSNYSKDRFKALQDNLVERFPIVCREVNDKVAQIVHMVKQLPPDELLKRAFWNRAGHALITDSEANLDQSGILAQRMLDYIQSIIAGATPSDTIASEISEEQWTRLEKLVDEMFSQLNFEYQVCRTAFARRNDPNFNEDYEEYYFKAQLYWCNIRGNRYQIHDIPFYRDVLAPHDDVLKEDFGLSAEELVIALQNIHDSLTFGAGLTMEDFHNFQQEISNSVAGKVKELGNISQDQYYDLANQIIEDNKWEDRRDKIIGRMVGLDLFDIQKISNLPEALLDQLSWEPGQDKEFLAEGKYQGWPLRIWPIFKRPFIKLNGHYYCFELFSLFDNFYRVIQRILIRARPSYSSEWNNKQKILSEEIPLNLLKKILPSAIVHKSVNYRWHTGQGSNKQWCETDSILIYEDHLFIIEIKAGAFTYTPPATDFTAYIESLRNLVFRPVEQGKRFLEYLSSEDIVDISDKNRCLIGKISRKDYAHITICTITLDPFTELAAQVEHLKKIGLDVGTHPIWSISIDDLRVYADVFDNPLIFLHYVEQRIRAFKSKIIKTEDELDHLGLYLKHNVYSEYARSMNLDELIQWHGYRSDIDRYFARKLQDVNTPCFLKQSMPKRIKEIVYFLSQMNTVNRRKVSSWLLDLSSEWREKIANGIENTLLNQINEKKAKPLSVQGNTNATIFCWQRNLVERDEKLALDHSLASMLVTGDKERLLLELMYDDNRTLVDIKYKHLIDSDISKEDEARLRSMSDSIRIKRVSTARQLHGEIGRNDPCPCGSGKKYKKCCLLKLH